MFKLASVAALLFAGVVSADDNQDFPPQFPEIDDGHFNGGHARISVTYENRKCGKLWNRFNDIIDGFVNEDPGEGHYSQHTKSWFTRSWIAAERTDKMDTETDAV